MRRASPQEFFSKVAWFIGWVVVVVNLPGSVPQFIQNMGWWTNSIGLLFGWLGSHGQGLMMSQYWSLIFLAAGVAIIIASRWFAKSQGPPWIDLGYLLAVELANGKTFHNHTLTEGRFALRIAYAEAEHHSGTRPKEDLGVSVRVTKAERVSRDHAIKPFLFWVRPFWLRSLRSELGEQREIDLSEPRAFWLFRFYPDKEPGVLRFHEATRGVRLTLRWSAKTRTFRFHIDITAANAKPKRCMIELNCDASDWLWNAKLT